MSMRMNVSPGLYGRNNSVYKSGDFYTQKTVEELNNARSDGQYMSSLRKLENQNRENEKRTSVVEQGLSYAKSLEASRTKSKEAALEKKKLQYNSKKISSQIVRSKDSRSARSAASAAKREVMRLKRLKGDENYDQEELQISIEHAKAMERVAKKKVHHLQQEEMIERNGNGLAGDIEEREENGEERNDDEVLTDEEKAAEDAQQAFDVLGSYRNYGAEMAANSEYIMNLQEEFELELEESQEELMESLEESQALMMENAQETSDMTEEMMQELGEAMSEMMEELDLTDLEQTMYAADTDMSKEDLKMLKIKHRNKEMKDIVKADADYLKAIFEKNESDKKAGTLSAATFAASNAPAISSTVSASPAPMPQVTIPAAYGSGGVNITL